MLKALETQSNFLIYFEDQENVPFMTSGLTIDAHNTKSYKDLSIKLVEQVKAFSEAFISNQQSQGHLEQQNEELLIKFEH